MSTSHICPSLNDVDHHFPGVLAAELCVGAVRESVERTRRRRADHYRACGARQPPHADRSTRTMGVMNLVSCVLVGLVVSASATASETTAGPKPGDVAPAHIGTKLDGLPVLVSDFPGKVIIVSYWATWCSFCIKELAMLDAVQTAGGEHLQVVTVNIEPAYIFKKVAKKLSRLSIPLLYDPDKKGRKAYGVEGIPHMIIVGKDGRIDTVNIGYSEDQLDDVVALINRAIGASPAE
jgi:thiol-disulfide isomerase/thioredoxin